jgi:hypothetical protein
MSRTETRTGDQGREPGQRIRATFVLESIPMPDEEGVEGTRLDERRALSVLNLSDRRVIVRAPDLGPLSVIL